MLTVRPFKGMQRCSDGSIKKAFSTKEVEVPFQLALASYKFPDPRWQVGE